MSAAAYCRLIGRWRIVEADHWDRAYPDFCGPPKLTITALGGEITLGDMEASLKVGYARDSVDLRRCGSDGSDQVEGEGTAQLLADGTIEMEFSYFSGDEAVLKAERQTSSTAY